MRPSHVLSVLSFAAALVTEIIFGRAPGEAPALPPR
jgi:hypothetical protein